MLKLYSRSIIRNPIRLMSGSSIKSNDNDESADRFQDCQKYNSRFNKNKVIDKLKKQSTNLFHLMRSEDPVEGEPVPPAKNPYINTKDPSLKGFRPEGVDESKTSFFLFPGQGSQFVGMGEKLFKDESVRHMFKVAENILGYNLAEVCFQGPEDKLNQTLYSQPAIFVTSLAAIEKFRHEYPGVVENAIGAAGFSMGEITSLVFSGALTFEDGLRLVKIRAEEMQKVCEETTSGLLTVIYGRDAKVGNACKAASDYCLCKGIEKEQAICSVANHLFPHCKVIGGHIEALNFIQNNAKDFGIKRCKRINASGAFHTKLMYTAKKNLYKFVDKLPVRMTNVPVYSNYDGLPFMSEEEIKYKLLEQIDNSVKWEQIMFTVFTRKPEEEHPWIFECGPGTNLLSILKNVNRRAYLKAKHIDV